MTRVAVVCQGTQMFRKRHVSCLSYSTSSCLVDQVLHRSFSFTSASSIFCKDLQPCGLIFHLHKLWLSPWPSEELLTSSSSCSLLYSDLAFFLRLESGRPLQPLNGFLLVVSSVVDRLKSKEPVFYVVASYVQLADWHYSWSSV